jgi:predicted phage terminase large subunit-like protein
VRGEPGTRHGIEEALHGLAAVQELRRLPEMAGAALRGIRAEKDKLSRALPWATRAEAGKVCLVRGAWNGAFLDEVCAFDGSGRGHDDQVDTISGGVQMIARGGSSAVGAFS